MENEGKIEKIGEKPILIDLDYYLLHVNCPEIDIFFSLDFSKPPRPFHFAVIALVASEMKKNNNMEKISVKKHIKNLELLDKKLLDGTKFISETRHGIFVKVTTAWKKRVKHLDKGGLFDLIDPVNDPFENRIINRSPTYDENDFWEKLIEIWGSNENASLKLAVDAVGLSLNDVKIVFNGREENAWGRFVDNLKMQNLDETKEENSIVDGTSQLKNEVIKFLMHYEERFMYLEVLHTHKKVKMDEQIQQVQVISERRNRQDSGIYWVFDDAEIELKKVYAFKFSERESFQLKSWDEAKKFSKRIVVLGDPGMGKTTLLRRETAIIARHEREKLENCEIALDETVFPIFLRLSDFSEGEESIFDDILKLVKHKYKEISNQVMVLFKKKLETEKCILLLDALDEISVEKRNKLINKLSDFIVNYPCQIICTSRIVGYPGFFLEHAMEFEIAPFNQKQIRSYIKRWFKSSVDTIKDKSVSDEALLHELNNKPQIKGLAQNPLLLSLICSLYEEGGAKLPARRCFIYKKSVEYMLSKWSRKRSYQTESRIQFKINIIEQIALHLLCKNQEIITLNELLECIGKQIEENSYLGFSNNVESLITELSTADGIFKKIDRDGDRYIFFHKTFQEFLAASCLERKYKKERCEGLEYIRKHYPDLHWHESLALLAGLLKDPITLIEDIASKKDDIFGSLLILQGRCAVEIEKKFYPLIMKIIEKIYAFWCFHPEQHYISSTLAELGQIYRHVLNMIIKVLHEENSEKREIKRMAIKILGSIGGYYSIEALIRVLYSDDNSLRYYAKKSLTENGSIECVNALMQTLKAEDSMLKQIAADALGEIGSLDTIPALIQALKDEASNVRQSAAGSLGKIGASDSIPALIQALEDEASNVRKSAADALGKIGASDSVPALIQALKDEARNVRKSAADALGEIGSSDSISALIYALKDEEFLVRLSAAEALSEIGSTEGKTAMINALACDDMWVREQAVFALEKIGTIECIKALINTLRDKNGQIKFAAATALRRIKNREIVNKLIKNLKFENVYVKDASEYALGKFFPEPLGTVEYIKYLKRNNFFTEPRIPVVQVSEIDNHESVKVLIRALKDDHFWVRLFAADTLRRIESKESKEALIKALDDCDRDTRRIVAKALKRLGTLDILKTIIKTPGINIYNYETFKLTRTLANRHSNKNVDFIPVYPEVIEKYRSTSDNKK